MDFVHNYTLCLSKRTTYLDNNFCQILTDFLNKCVATLPWKNYMFKFDTFFCIRYVFQ